MSPNLGTGSAAKGKRKVRSTEYTGYDVGVQRMMDEPTDER